MTFHLDNDTVQIAIVHWIRPTNIFRTQWRGIWFRRFLRTGSLLGQDLF